MAVVALFSTTAVSLGQGPFGNTVEHEDGGEAGEVASETDVVPPTVTERSGTSTWRRVEIGLEEAFDEFRREAQPKRLPDGFLKEDEGSPLSVPDPDPTKGSFSNDSGVRKNGQSKIVDAAIDSLAERACIFPAGRTFGYDGAERIVKVRNLNQDYWHRLHSPSYSAASC